VPKVAEEYCWAITEAGGGRPCCGRSASTALESGFQRNPPVYTYIVARTYIQFRLAQNSTCAAPCISQGSVCNKEPRPSEPLIRSRTAGVLDVCTISGLLQTDQDRFLPDPYLSTSLLVIVFRSSSGLRFRPKLPLLLTPLLLRMSPRLPATHNAPPAASSLLRCGPVT
jgi:hypothetical protein